MRREFLKTLAAVPLLTAVQIVGGGTSAKGQEAVRRVGGPRLKTSLNAYSFNEPLRNGTMTLSDVLAFCAEVGFDGVDLTAYYFPGYPRVPDDALINRIKREAFVLGLDISGTGVRNDFTSPDATKRRGDVVLVKEWIDVAVKLGAPVIRIFAGKEDTSGYTWKQVAEWMVRDIAECVAYGRERGVMVAIQNHNDFIKTAEDALTILRMVDSPWFGLILDTGSYRSGDAYEQIRMTAPFAVNWQVKERITVDGRDEATDLDRIVRIIRGAGYRGYVPVETLGPGDPKEKVRSMFEAFRKALS